MISPPRAWPCEYCGESHGPLVVCVPRAETIFALLIGVGVRLACQFIVEPDPELVAEPVGLFGMIDDGTYTPNEGTWLGIDRSQFAQFASEPPIVQRQGIFIGSREMVDSYRALVANDRRYDLVEGGRRAGKTNAARGILIDETPNILIQNDIETGVDAMFRQEYEAQFDEPMERVEIPTRALIARVRISKDLIEESRYRGARIVKPP